MPVRQDHAEARRPEFGYGEAGDSDDIPPNARCFQSALASWSTPPHASTLTLRGFVSKESKIAIKGSGESDRERPRCCAPSEKPPPRR